MGDSDQVHLQVGGILAFGSQLYMQASRVVAGREGTALTFNDSTATPTFDLYYYDHYWVFLEAGPDPGSDLPEAANWLESSAVKDIHLLNVRWREGAWSVLISATAEDVAIILKAPGNQGVFARLQGWIPAKATPHGPGYAWVEQPRRTRLKRVKLQRGWQQEGGALGEEAAYEAGRQSEG